MATSQREDTIRQGSSATKSVEAPLEPLPSDGPKLAIKEPLIRSSGWKILKARFVQFVAEYQTLTAEDRARNPEANQRIVQILDDVGTRRLRRDDLRTIGTLIVSLLPEPQLQPRVQMLLDQIRQLTPNAGTESWFERILSGWDGLDEHARRARVQELQSERVRLGIMQWAGESLRTQMITRSVTATVAVVVFVIGAAALIANPERPVPKMMPTIAVLIAGAVGGFVSVLYRIYTTPSRTLAETAYLESPSTTTVSLSPVFGAVGAALVLLGLRAGVFSGGMFPTFADTNGGASATVDSLVVLGDLKIADLFKLLLISLAAGHSERLVPDTLGRVGSTLG